MPLRREHQGEQNAGRSSRPRQRPPAGAPAPTGATGADGLMALQRSAGNAAVAAIVQRSRSPQGDHDPGERQHGPDGGEERAATRPVQRLTVHDVLRRPGQPMEPALRQEMEQRFGGENFASVRMHTGAEADRSAAELDALAYTSRSHVVLSGKAVGDKRVIAHELEHIRQQREGSVAGTDHGDGVSVSEPKDEFEQSADAVADRVMRAPLPPAGRGPSGSGGLPGVQRDIQRTAGDQAATSHVPRIQRYETGTNPITPELAPDSGDQLPAFAVNSGSVSVTLDQEGAFQGDIARYVEPEGPVTIAWSGDETMAINSTKSQQPKEFYAVPEVVGSANRRLATAGSYVRLAQGGHSVTNSRGERLTVVRPRMATDQDDVVRERFMHLVQHECVEVAEKVVGGSLGHAMFRGTGGRGVSGDIGPRGDTGLSPLAAALASRRPPTTPQQAAEAVQGPRPALDPGEEYGTRQGVGRLTSYEQSIGINDYARARVGEALTTRTIPAEPRSGVPEGFDFARNRVPAERIWVYHYATVLAESRDGGDQITLENFNRNSMMESLMRDAAREVATAYVSANPGSPRMPRREAEQVANGLLEREARSAMGDLWYFKIYQPGTERSFHSENRRTALNAMTVATTSVPRLFFEEDSTDRLRPFSLSRLTAVAETWRQSAGQIVVEGHAHGGIIALRGRARLRAEAVARELRTLGIGPERIIIRVRDQSDARFASVYSAEEPEVYVPGNRQ
ncbi:eCIS core domain-containing protein [Streptomyces hainanensis]|uniref:DUF4157 domain-containing protein n=1 Tax=Streptomyces hainanensis TaxID=402648 RepID=A0A4V2Y1C7_9ACTN|nr:DUF4157 domain-containing protein [Streptomyces hainanensis]TDC68255.1 DUF4157 domain-containing protein [Streptomyces hainanensis]